MGSLRRFLLALCGCAAGQFSDWSLSATMECTSLPVTETLAADHYLVIYLAEGAEVSFSFLLSGGSCTTVRVLPMTACITVGAMVTTAVAEYSCEACPSSCAAEPFTMAEAGCVLVMNEGDGSSSPPDETVVYAVGCEEEDTTWANVLDVGGGDGDGAAPRLPAVNVTGVGAGDFADAADAWGKAWGAQGTTAAASSSKKGDDDDDGYLTLGMILAIVGGVVVLACVLVGAFFYNAYENGKALGETTVRRDRPRGAHAHFVPEEEAAALEMATQQPRTFAYNSAAGSSCVGAGASSSSSSSSSAPLSPKEDVVDAAQLEVRLPSLATSPAKASARADTSLLEADRPTGLLMAASRAPDDDDDDDDDLDHVAPSYSRHSPSKASALAPPPAVPHNDTYHYLAADGSQRGPTDLAALARAFDAKEISAATLVFNPHLGPDWKAIADVPALFAELGRAPTAGALEDIAL